MLGFDSLYRNDFGDDEIIELALQEKRIILTRDKLLLRSRRVTHGYYVRATEKHAQLREVVQKFDLYSQFKSFTRCMTCNSFMSFSTVRPAGSFTGKAPISSGWNPLFGTSLNLMYLAAHQLTSLCA